MTWFFCFLLTFFIFFKPGLGLAEAQETDPPLEEQIYVKPVEGLEVGLFGITPEQIVKALMEDNYQAYFANSPSTIHPEIAGNYERFLELSDATIKLNPKENAGINRALNISSPLIFNDERSATESSENSLQDVDFTLYHGNAVTTDRPFLKETTSANYYRQLSLEDQCLTQKTALEQLERLCEKLEDPAQCPLDTKIAHSELSQRQLLEQIEDLDCNKFSDPEELLKIPTELRVALANVPFYQTNSYRLAFVVQVMRQEPQTGLFQFLRDLFLPDGQDTVQVMTIVVPEPGTESNPNDDAIEYHHLSRQILTPFNSWQTEEEQQTAEKLERKQQALAALEAGFSEESLIDCANCQVGSDQEIKTALAAIINGLEPSHYDKKLEKSELIEADANLSQEKASYNYSSGQNPFTSFVNDVLSNIVGIFNPSLTVGNQAREEIEQKEAEFRTYIVTPADIDPITVSQIFTPLETQEAHRELERPLSVAFNEGGGESAHSGQGETATHEFYDPEKCQPTVSPSPGASPVPPDDDCTNSFSVGLSSFTQNIGHQIGQLTRGSIEHLSGLVPFGNKIHEAFEATIYNEEPKTDLYLKGAEAAVEEQVN